MKRKFSFIAVTLLMLLVLVLPAGAATLPFVVDPNGECLNDEHIAQLEKRAEEVYAATGHYEGFVVSQSRSHEELWDDAETWYNANVGVENGIMLYLDNSSSTYVIYMTDPVFDNFVDDDTSYDTLKTAYDEPDTYYDGVNDFFNAYEQMIASEFSDPSTDPALLAGGVSTSGTASNDSAAALVFDEAGQLTADEIGSLSTLAAEASEQNHCNIYFAVVPTFNGLDAETFVKQYYTGKGLGYGSGKDGIISIVAVQDRYYWINTFGNKADRLFTDDEIVELQDDILPFLKDSDWYGAAKTFIEQSDLIMRGHTFEAVERQLPLVVDYADALSDDKEAKFNQMANELTEKYQCEVAVVFIDSLEGKTAEAYADDFYDYEGYGYGPDDDGIMFLVATKDRKFATSTYGYGITAFTDYGLLALEDDFVPKLKNQDWEGAAEVFLNDCDEFLQAARDGKPIDKGQLSAGGLLKHIKKYFIGDLVIGFLFALIPMSILKKRLKPVALATNANQFVVDGSLTITAAQDNIVSHNTYRRKIEKSSGGGGGGSSTHRSSSGRSHGGHSGGF